MSPINGLRPAPPDLDPYPPLIGPHGFAEPPLSPRRGDLKRALERVGDAHAGQILLASDFDGTLAPIVTDPAMARVLPANLALIDRLIEVGVRVAVISGRALPDLRDKLPLEHAQLFGENGLSVVTDIERHALKKFNAKAGQAVARIPGAWIEVKPGTTSVHFRAAPDSGPEIEARVLPLAGQLGLIATIGRMVIEVKPQRADKVNAMSALIAALEPKVVIYAGDDEPDQGVFAMLNGMHRRSIAIGISSAERHVDAFATCDLVYEGPNGMAEFLHGLLALLARRHPA